MISRFKVFRSHRGSRFVAAAAAVAALSAPSMARAAVYFVSPDGTGSCCTKEAPCALDMGAQLGTAGDTVFLLDGTYASQSLRPTGSGTASAWLTFEAYPGAVPILDGKDADVQAVGVDSQTSTYVRFIGIVARNWAGGFTNKWIGSTTDFTANGNWQYINCIADGNTRNGFAFNSSKGILIRECISAHNGTSTTSSWSSGFQLYGVQGSATDNVVERNVSFENTDNQKHSDGSGFIVDTKVTGVAFINNLSFLNGGSGIRLTDGKNIVIINNTFYHNGRDTSAKDPNYPAEIYFTDGTGSTLNLTMINNVGIGSGTTQDPTKAWTTDKGTISIAASNKTAGTFAGADGMNPDFHLATGSALAEAGDMTAMVPTTDIGFDPKCLTKVKPTDVAAPSWSAYSIDYAYIKMLGGVAKCWKPGMRPAGTKVDVGAYELDATPAPSGTGGFAVGMGGSSACMPGAGGGGGSGSGAGGAAGTSAGSGSGGASTGSGSGGANGTGSGGATSSNGSGGNGNGSGGNGNGSGGNGNGNGSGGNGNKGSGGSSSGSSSGGAMGNGSGGSSSSSSSGGAQASGGSSSSGSSSGGSGSPGASASNSGGCACDVGSASNGAGVLAALFAGAAIAFARRRRRDDHDSRNA